MGLQYKKASEERVRRMYTYKKDSYFKDNTGIEVLFHTIAKHEPEHLHEFIEMVYILHGSGVHGIDGVEYDLKPGSLLFINYRQVHYFRTDTEMEMCNILLDPEWISEKLIDSENAFELLTLSAFSYFSKDIDGGRPLIMFSGEERQQIERLLKNMAMEKAEKKTGYTTVLKSQAMVMLTYIFREMSSDIAPVRKGFTPEFLAYIRENCSEKLTLNELAKKCFYNPSYFSRLFKEHYGVTVTEFINQIRLEKAMEMLLKTELSVEEIVERTGFSRKATFYKLLKENTGMTPQDFRKSKIS